MQTATDEVMQVHVFYEALGYLISSEHDGLKRDALVEKLMGLPNTVWDEVSTVLLHILRSANERVCPFLLR